MVFRLVVDSLCWLRNGLSICGLTLCHAPTLSRTSLRAIVVWILLWAPDSFFHQFPSQRCLEFWSTPDLFFPTDFQANFVWILLATPTFPPYRLPSRRYVDLFVETRPVFSTDFQANAVKTFLLTPDIFPPTSKPTMSASFCRHPNLSSTDSQANAVWNLLTLPDPCPHRLQARMNFKLHFPSLGHCPWEQRHICFPQK